MHPEKRTHDQSQPEYSRFIQMRGKLALLDLERYEKAIGKRLGAHESGKESIGIVSTYAAATDFVLRELSLSVLLTGSSFLSYKERVEYGNHFGITDHKHPHYGYGLWYFPGFSPLQPTRLLTEWKIARLRVGQDRALKSLDEQTPTQIAEKFYVAIDTKLKNL